MWRSWLRIKAVEWKRLRGSCGMGSLRNFLGWKIQGLKPKILSGLIAALEALRQAKAFLRG
jgi:hypothetical protein